MCFFSSVCVCLQCDLANAVHQLLSNHSIHEEDEAESDEHNVTISVSDFPSLAAGSILYLSSPSLACAAVKQGRWAEETEHFLHQITHGDHHEHGHEEGETHHKHEDEHEDEHEHEHIDSHGLQQLFHELHEHYEPSPSEVRTTVIVKFQDTVMTFTG